MLGITIAYVQEQKPTNQTNKQLIYISPITFSKNLF